MHGRSAPDVASTTHALEHLSSAPHGMGVAGEHARRRCWSRTLVLAAAITASLDRRCASAADPAAFKAWIAQHGVSTAKVDMAKECGPGVRGMVAAADVAVSQRQRQRQRRQPHALPPAERAQPALAVSSLTPGLAAQAGETLLDVPFALMMTLNTAQQGPLKKVIEEKQISPTMIMALHLLNEKLNPSSFYKDWISLLPEAFETPLFWGEEDLAGLQGSTILSVVQRRKETMQADYTALFDVLFAEYPELFKPEEYTFEAFRWALSTVWSRSFVFNIESQLVPVIVPFADMFEHANVESSFSLEDQEKVFRITLGKPLKAGERAYISLGAKPNSQLLMNYGFVLQDNL